MNEQLEALKEQFKGPDGTIDLVAFEQALAQSPGLQSFYQQELAKAKAGQRAALSSELLELGKNIGFSLSAMSQINSAKNQAANMAQPGIPLPPGLSPELTQALYQAQRGADFAPALAPARQGIEDAYTGALNQAQTASGGQAGAFQAMSQLANIERMKAQLGLAPIAQQVQMQNQGMANDLLGARVDERQRDYMNRYYASQMAMDQYNKNREGLSDQLTAGKTNLYGAINGITQGLQGLTPYYRPPNFGQRETLKDWMDKEMMAFDEEDRAFAQRAYAENNAQFMPQGISNNPYESYSGSFSPDTFGQARVSLNRPMYS